jgi:hypothetical protein
LNTKIRRLLYLRKAPPEAPKEGVKHDTDKVRVELYPPEALLATSRVLTFGAKKYAERNWERGSSFPAPGS